MNKPLRFILVDDNVYELALSEKIIQRFDRTAEILNFMWAADALEFIIQDSGSKADNVATILLTDLHMPEMDGLALLESIDKLNLDTGRQFYAFLLSAAANCEEIAKVLYYTWVKDCFSKPLSLEKVVQMANHIQYPD